MLANSTKLVISCFVQTANLHTPQHRSQGSFFLREEEQGEVASNVVNSTASVKTQTSWQKKLPTVDVAFKNSVIIHDDNTKENTTAEEAWIPGLN